MRLNFLVDADSIVAELQNFKQEAKKAIEDGVKALAASTHAKVKEFASSKLSTTRKMYMDNLDFQEVQPGIWVVSLDAPALWIEEGRKSGDMTEDLLKNNAHTAKDGSKYKAIPFEHSKAPSQQGAFQKEMVRLIKQVLRDESSRIGAKIPFKKLEYNPDGSPRIGLLHKFDITSPKPTARASHEALSGLRIYQTQTAEGKVRRDIMTFRMVSSKHKGNKWIHPGREGDKFFEQALEWANQAWENEILPEILKRFK